MRALLVAAMCFFAGGCIDQHESFVASCRKIARVEIRRPQLWARYLRQVHEEQSVAAATPVRLFPTKDFDAIPQWADEGLRDHPRDKPFEDYYRIMERASGKLIARAYSLSMRVTGFDSPGFWTCIHNEPQLYGTELVKAAPKG
jgi:hypothetical protein